MSAPALARPAASSTRILQIARKGTLAVADQGLFSGANFLLNILLARWLSAADYGAYSLAFAVFLLFAAVHSAILVEPMMVFGAGKYFTRFSQYLKVLIASHWAVMLPVSVLLFGATLVLRQVYSQKAAAAFLGLVFGAGGILLFWLVRRVFYVLLRPAWGVAGGAVYFVLLLAAISALQFTGHLSTTTAFAGMGVAGLLASAILLARFFAVFSAEQHGPSLSETAREHWRYGRWAMATAIIGWFPGHVYYALLPAHLGLEGSAGLRALMNFVLPVLQAISALTMLLLPMLVRDRHNGGVRRMNRTMWQFLSIFAAGAVVYLTGLWLLRDEVFQVFYAGKYSQYAGWPLFLAGLLPLGTCATAVLGNALRALERPDSIFWCYAGSLIGAVTVGVPCSTFLGVSGALLGLLASSLITVLMMAWFYVRALRQEHSPEHSGRTECNPAECFPCGGEL